MCVFRENVCVQGECVCSCIRRTLAYPGVKSLVLSLCLCQCLHERSTPAARGMSPIVRNSDCFNPMLCHCKVACHDNTLSLMFGCKVGIHHQCCFAGKKPFEFLILCISTFERSRNAVVLPDQEVCHKYVDYWAVVDLLYIEMCCTAWIC